MDVNDDASISAGHGSAVVANVGSIVGLFTTPFAAAYCSSKAAVHSITDALRMELKPFGIHVVSIQPGGVRSSFGDHAEAALLRRPPPRIIRGGENSVRLPLLKRLLPGTMFDAKLSRIFGLDALR